MQNFNIKFTGKITAAIIEQGGKIFIAQRAKKGGREGLWEFPGGKQEEGETIQECLKRELFEEFDIKAVIGNYLCSSFFTLKNKPAELMAFYVTSYEGKINCKEHKNINWVTPEQLLDYNFTNPDLIFIDAIHKREKIKS